jgi:NADH-quinone oxidoreductase subunit L
LFGRYLGWGTCYITTGSVFSSLLLSIYLLHEVVSTGVTYKLTMGSWIVVDSLHIDWSFCFDSLTSIMLIVVTFISTLVHLYSTEYMEFDPHLPRFMSYLSLFTFFMLILITANNFLQMFVGWEGVGLSSYLLINFWFTRIQANKAAIKAVIVNRVGDMGLVIGILAIFYIFKTVNYTALFSLVPFYSLELDNSLYLLGFNIDALTFICIFLFIGSVGKSAQIGLHTWLPDAMEGPTPVSALIHAATMVTAGVFLLARCSPLFEYSSTALGVVTCMGAMTAFFAATTALVQNDLKRVIAYSTCSQLGYMVFACGISNYNVGVFHLANHAFFKALLFLGAGSIIHAFKDEQDIRNMGGVRKKLPYTYIFMLLGTLALTGFPFLSGFYSKDAIIEFAYLKNSSLGNYAAVIGILTAFLTSIYSWRLFFKAFHGPYNNKKIPIDETHESPLVMLIPLVFLGIGAVFSGYLFKTTFIGHHSNEFWQESIFFLNEIKHESIPLWFLLITPILVLISIPISFYLYISKPKILEDFKNTNMPLYNFLLNKWYVDEFYEKVFVNPAKKIGSFFWKKGDVGIIDRFGPDGVSKLVKIISNKTARLQTGFIYDYAFVMLLGLSILLTYLILK